MMLYLHQQKTRSKCFFVSLTTSPWSHQETRGFICIFMRAALLPRLLQVGTVLRNSPTCLRCCTWALSSLCPPSASGKTLHQCGHQGTEKLLSDERHIRVWKIGNELFGGFECIRFNFTFVDFLFQFCKRVSVSVVSDPKRRSPTAECHRTTHHSGW